MRFVYFAGAAYVHAFVPAPAWSVFELPFRGKDPSGAGAANGTGGFWSIALALLYWDDPRSAGTGTAHERQSFHVKRARP